MNEGFLREKEWESLSDEEYRASLQTMVAAFKNNRQSLNEITTVIYSNSLTDSEKLRKIEKLLGIHGFRQNSK